MVTGADITVSEGKGTANNSLVPNQAWLGGDVAVEQPWRAPEVVNPAMVSVMICAIASQSTVVQRVARVPGPVSSMIAARRDQVLGLIVLVKNVVRRLTDVGTTVEVANDQGCLLAEVGANLMDLTAAQRGGEGARKVVFQSAIGGVKVHQPKPLMAINGVQINRHRAFRRYEGLSPIGGLKPDEASLGDLK